MTPPSEGATAAGAIVTAPSAQSVGDGGWTKGPWCVDPISAQVVCGKIGLDGDPLPVAQMLWPTTERSEDETLANAYLIAAAPDLFAALALLCDRFDTIDGVPFINPPSSAWAVARAALARALGQPVKS